MQSVGTRLREARIKKGYTLEDINARTRISLKNLNAIESDDLSKISSPFTYRSFVKQVAELIGVDHNALSPDALAASSTMPEPLVPGQEEEIFVRPHQFRPAKPKRNLTWVYRTASIAALAGAVSAYLIWRNGGTEAAKLYPAPLPASSEVVTPPTAAVPAPQPEHKEQAPPPPVAAPVQTAKSQPEPVVQAPPQPGTEQLLPPESTPPLGSRKLGAPRIGQQAANVQPESTLEMENATIHIELSAMESTWLTIVADGKTTYTGKLEAMQTKVVDGKETARIRTANAGGVNIIFNGRALGPLGRHGQSRTFVFTKTGYEVVLGANAEPSRVSPSAE